MSEIISNNKNNILINSCKFIILSLLGIILFMIPFKTDNGFTIPVANLSNMVQQTFKNQLPYVVTLIICTTAIGTLIYKIFKPKFIKNMKILYNLFNVNITWTILRVLGAIFAICSLFNVGPSFITSPATGSMILFDLLPILFSVFLFAGLLLPLLLNFGLLEFVGALLVKVMRPIFNLPGRSSIDCIASWLGDGTIGILLTSKQYEEGFYTEREAAVIGTTFSLVSLTFSLVVIDTVGLGNMFFPFYLTVTFSGIIAAIILPKLPPLSKKKDIYYTGNPAESGEILPNGYSPVKYGFEKALEKAENANVITDVFVKGFGNVIDMWFAVMPMVMAVGTIALIIAEFTPVFKILGLPFLPLLYLLRVPEALAASETLMAGFADMLLPSVMASSITSPMTRFIVASVSVTQLIYLSEVGSMLLSSKIPINLKELFIIFIQRTILTLPIIGIIAHILF